MVGTADSGDSGGVDAAPGDGDGIDTSQGDATGIDAPPGESTGVEAGDASVDPDAFQSLGNDVRLTVLQSLLDRETSDGGPASFSDLHAATDVEASAGFAYHLRQLTGRYVRKVDLDGEEGYVLTYAGRKIARAIAAGTYTDSVDLAPIDLEEPCPHCGEADLVARCADNVVGIACEACGRPVLSLPFPPSGYRDRDPGSIPAAFDRHHRHRLGMLRDGVCPECSGSVEVAVERPRIDDGEPPATSDDGGPATAGRTQATFECRTCGHGARTPVALTLLDHPAVAAFYHDHGIDLRERPLWNVGDEWRETVVGDESWCVVVSTKLDDEVLELFVDPSLRVIETRRTTVEE